MKAVIFDIDDTLYNYEECNVIAQKAVFKYISEKYSIAPTEVADAYKQANRLVKSRLKNVAASHNRMLYMQNMMELLGQKPAIDSLECYQLFWDTFLQKMCCYEYVHKTFELLQQNEIKIAILSDLTAMIQHRKLKKLGIDQFIDVLVTSEEAGEEKPGSKMFDLILKKLDLLPQEVIMVGDSLSKDVDGAKAVGMQGIWFSECVHDTEHMCGEQLFSYLKEQV